MANSITDDDASYAFDIVKTICTKVGPGLPASSQERERAAILQQEMALHLGAGQVTIEEFTLAPWAFVSAYPISALLLLLAALLNFSLWRLAEIPPLLTASVALVLSIAAPLLFVLEFILGIELVDPFFKKKQSLNVIGTLRPPATASVKRLLILSGHHDSAPENTWLRSLGYGFFFLSTTWLIALFAMLGMSAIQLTGIITGNAGLVRFGTMSWVMLAYPILPAVVFGLFFNRGEKSGGTVPGAADNLSASALVVAMCRFLARNPSCVPDGTEIRFVSFGSEEAGYRGSRRYVERHLNELKRLDAQLLNIETVAYPEITIFTSDTNGFVKNSPEMVQSVVTAAERAGVPFKVRPAYLGVGNDSGPFSRAGIKAVTLFPFKMPQQMVAFYHQKWDSPEVLTIEPLLNVLKLAFKWLCNAGNQR